MSSALPPGWCYAPFEELAENLDGKRVPVRASDRASRRGNYPYYGASGIIDQVEDFLFDGSYLLIAEDGANLLTRGTPIAFQAHGRFWVNNHAHVTKPLHDAPLAYLEAFLNSINLARHVTGTAQPKLTQKALNRIEVPVAPVNEQRRIVAKLEALQSRSRRAREALDAVPPLLEKLRQSILAAAFRGDLTKDWRAQNPNTEPASALLARIRTERRKKWEESEIAKLKAKGKPPTDDRWKAKYKEPEPVDTTGLPDLPEGWEWASLGEVAWDCGYGTSEKCDYGGGGAPVLRIPNIAQGILDLRDLKRALHIQDMRDLLVAPGDLLIVRTNGSRDLIGRAAVVTDEMDEPTSFASYLIRFRLTPVGSMPLWVGRCWQSLSIRAAIETHAASSAGQYNVSLGELSSCTIPVAPAAEQTAVLGMIDRALAGGVAARRLTESSLLRARELERAFLAKAFRGDLVPQDPNDEPADVMLARLRSDSTPESSRPRHRRSKAAE